ncbi:eukaryotic translation initiation factor 4B-like isoform X1 [Papaver somniferum]|uniref:eukaryotic translation initiation factor 4B-like isoform X1 n=1 Tax=Papaver somniferum TaxID=3469 RepID=UPI000E701233|nr:eukaryotic translation initiation factor 4B-like isoform X1 [Papaver somniferum]
MDANMRSKSPDESDGKPSFRKPSNDGGNRKYRRYSPVNEPGSSLSGSPKHGRSPSPPLSRENYAKLSDDSRKRKDEGRESHKQSERHSHGRSRDYRRDDDYSGYHKHMDGEKDYKRSSMSGRESRSNTTDYSRRDGKSDRSRGYSRNPDKYSRDTQDEFHRDRERDSSALERHKHKEKYNSSDAAEADKTVEREMRNRVRGGERDETRDCRRSFGEYKNDHTSSSGFKGEGKDLLKGKDNNGSRVKGSHGMDGQNAEAVEKQKHREGESDRLKGRYDKEADEDSSVKRMKANLDSDTSFVKAREPVPKFVSASDENLTSNSKTAQGSGDGTVAKPAQTSYNEAEFADSLNAAKVAATKAAEMVNKNLVGGGYMSTDQKKKLLWGNKKNAATEEVQSGNRWDVPLFGDRERQEKFNKLMSLRLRWYLWPIVGCKGRSENTGANQRTTSREAKGAPAGFGEAIYCWTTQERWTYCWVRSIVVPISSFVLSLSYMTRMFSYNFHFR